MKEKFPSLQPNIFPKFLFHFADFPYKLCVHQPEPAQLENLLRFTVRSYLWSIIFKSYVSWIFKEQDGGPVLEVFHHMMPKAAPLFGTVIASSQNNSIPKTTRATRTQSLKEKRKLSVVSILLSPRITSLLFRRRFQPR